MSQGPSNGNISILENHIAEVKADEIGNLSERSGGSAKKHIPDDFFDEQVRDISTQGFFLVTLSFLNFFYWIAFGFCFVLHELRLQLSSNKKKKGNKKIL